MTEAHEPETFYQILYQHGWERRYLEKPDGLLQISDEEVAKTKVKDLREKHPDRTFKLVKFVAVEVDV